MFNIFFLLLNFLLSSLSLLALRGKPPFCQCFLLSAVHLSAFKYLFNMYSSPADGVSRILDFFNILVIVNNTSIEVKSEFCSQTIYTVTWPFRIEVALAFYPNHENTMFSYEIKLWFNLRILSLNEVKPRKL